MSFGKKFLDSCGGDWLCKLGMRGRGREKGRGKRARERERGRERESRGERKREEERRSERAEEGQEESRKREEEEERRRECLMYTASDYHRPSCPSRVRFHQRESLRNRCKVREETDEPER